VKKKILIIIGAFLLMCIWFYGAMLIFNFWSPFLGFIAESEANRLRQQTITPLLVQQQFIEKWDGKTPLYGQNPVMFKSVP